MMTNQVKNICLVIYSSLDKILISGFDKSWYFAKRGLNSLDCNVLPFTFRVEDGERRSQPYFGEYYWLGPYFTQNIWERYILIFPAILNALFTVQPSA